MSNTADRDVSNRIRIHIQRSGLLIAVMASTFGLAHSALAQQAAAGAAPASASEDTLQEVVVTAERRSADIQTTPIAVSAISGTQLAEQQLNTITSLSVAVPSFQVNNGGVYQSINIRGIGNSVIAPSIQTGIAVFRDGLFQPETIGLGDPFYDIADVEILRGPQGTFVGQSSTGGAVLITSANPNFNGVNGFVEGLVGDYNDVKLTGAVNLPISDTWAARIAFNSEQRKSFFKNIGSIVTPGASHPLVDPGNVNDRDVRLSLLWKPSDSFQALLKLETNRGDTDGTPGQPNQNIPAYSPYYAFSTHSPYVLNHDRLDELYDLDVNRYGLEMKWLLPSGITVRSLTGMQTVDLKNIQDQDSSSANGQWLFQDVGPNDDYYSEELNILSPAEGPLTWVAGGSWFYRYTPVRINLYNAGFPFSAATPQNQRVNFSTVDRTVGVFGQITYQFTPTLQLQTGIRENWENDFNRGGILVTNPLPPPVGTVIIPVNSVGAYDQSVPTAKVGLNWQPTDTQFFYAFFARGFKSGGINGGPAPNFGPEHVNDWELGWKGKLFDGHLLTQIGGFYMDYQNLQQPVVLPINGRSSTINLGDSKIKGFEASAQGRFGGLGVDVGIAYTDSKLGSANVIAGYQLPDGGAGSLGPQCAVPAPGCFNYTPFTENLSGEANPYSPKLTANASINYGFDVGANVLRPKVSYNYTDKQYASIFQTDKFFFIPAHGLWNASLNYEANPWMVQAYVNNLTDRVYVAGYGPAFLGAQELYGSPRQVGVLVRRTF